MIPSTPAASPDLPPRRVHIVHGFRATPESHWFPWLRGELAARGSDARIIALPAAEAPAAPAWHQTLAAAIPEVDSETWIVAHSLGVISVLRRLADLDPPWTLGGLIAVSGFTGRLAALPALDAFLAEDADLTEVTPRISHRHSIYSDNDMLVPRAASAALAARLGSQTHVVPGAGHFLAADGFTSLPAITRILGVSPPPGP
ncbi:RBBP9/YdeN family alpha/beta hydrolase [Actinoplanes sp. RD1]|uniref:RBBP9/YdeN family alpha/beta hydrolase n=1 Tax=Actinoplanes sp. RD1 TaxID=3064538 RepID=UPI0027416F21|nr:alpha/beta hydrolase [Actinoplanes sp. RD1]